MFKKREDPIEVRIDKEILHLLELMHDEDGYSDDYKSMANQVLKLKELRAKPDIISKEAWLTLGTHVAGLIVILSHERTHIIASKAFGLVKKIV